MPGAAQLGSGRASVRIQLSLLGTTLISLIGEIAGPRGAGEARDGGLLDGDGGGAQAGAEVRAERGEVGGGQAVRVKAGSCDWGRGAKRG